jgi:hypothetical protein
MTDPSIIVKYFYEKSDNDFEDHKLLCKTHSDRIIICPDFEEKSKYNKICSLNRIINQIKENPKKDILYIPFPTKKSLTKNVVLDSILYNKNGIKYDDINSWFPKEIWIYNAIKNY